jgi:hypothetical protein
VRERNERAVAKEEESASRGGQRRIKVEYRVCAWKTGRKMVP